MNKLAQVEVYLVVITVLVILHEFKACINMLMQGFIISIFPLPDRYIEWQFPLVIWKG